MLIHWLIRVISIYGYCRGTNLKTNQPVHLIGVGDFNPDDISVLNDPCPTVKKQKEDEGGKVKRRTLNQKRKAHLCSIK